MMWYFVNLWNKNVHLKVLIFLLQILWYSWEATDSFFHRLIGFIVFVDRMYCVADGIDKTAVLPVTQPESGI